MDRGAPPPEAEEFDLDAPEASRRRDPDGDGHGGPDGPDGLDGGNGHSRGRGPLLGPWPDAAPAWLRGPAVVAAAALVAALLTGAAVAHQQRAAAARAVAVERVLGAVDVVDAAVSAAQYDDRGAAIVDADGRAGLRVDLTMNNTSDRPAEVTVTGIGIGADDVPLTVLRASAPRQLAPLGTQLVQLDAEVDCGAVPHDVSSSVATTTDWVGATAVVDGEERAVRWGAGSEWGGLARQLSDLCHPSQNPWVDVTSAVLLEDGRLQLDLQNAGAVGGEVDVETTEGGGGALVGEPALPLVLGAGEEASVVLTAAPDCAREGVLLDQAVRITVTPLEGSDDTSLYEVGDGGQLSAWMGRQTALVCG